MDERDWGVATAWIAVWICVILIGLAVLVLFTGNEMGERDEPATSQSAP